MAFPCRPTTRSVLAGMDTTVGPAALVDGAWQTVPDTARPGRSPAGHTGIARCGVARWRR